MLFEKPKTFTVNGQTFWVQKTETECTRDLITRVHYAHRMPTIQYAYALLSDSGIAGIVTFGPPASPYLCMGVCGKENRHLVTELNRLVLVDNLPNMASFLVGNALRMMPDRIVVSYADTAQKHIGTIYQATNFLFTGTTKARTDMATLDGGHSRHHAGDKTLRTDRSSKHRYVTFTGSCSFRREMRSKLLYEVMPYPKSEGGKP